MRRCLLDMDGVLVDFVGGACETFGVPNPYDLDKNLGVHQFYDAANIDRSRFYASLDEDFWFHLKPTPECFLLLRHLEYTFAGLENVALLTSPVDTRGCREGKFRWVQRHLPVLSRRMLVGTAKWFAAGPDTWLIDDSDKNIRMFREWGGHGILVPRPWNPYKSRGSWLDFVVGQLPGR